MCSIRERGGSVLAARRAMGFKHILVATDFGESSMHALNVALEIAQKFESTLTLAHIWEVPAYSFEISTNAPNELWRRIEQDAQGQLDAWSAALRLRWPKSDAVLRSGNPWQEVLAGAEVAHAELIVVGTHGRHGVARVLLGSVAERIVRFSKVPVLTVHGIPS